MSDEIKPGDVVKHRAEGGPKEMVVLDIEPHEGKPWATCQWFNGAKFENKTLPLIALELVHSYSDTPSA